LNTNIKDMKNVPNLLGKVKEWNPKTYLVTYYLSTDAITLKENANN